MAYPKINWSKIEIVTHPNQNSLRRKIRIYGEKLTPNSIFYYFENKYYKIDDYYTDFYNITNIPNYEKIREKFRNKLDLRASNNKFDIMEIDNA